MAKQKINSTNLGGLSFDKPAEILSAMKELRGVVNGSDENHAITSQIKLNALAKAFFELLTKDFKCSDEEVEELLKSIGSDNSYDITINNVSYTYSKETIVKPEIDKGFLSSEGVKTLKAYVEKLETEGKAIPSCVDISTKTIHSFKPDKWNGEPLAKEVQSEIVTINEKRK